MRTKTVKKASCLIIEGYYSKLTRDFQVNKKVCQDIACISSKRLRNQIAGYVTHLMKRIENGPVRGISIKLQEEERERRDNYQPDVSHFDTKKGELDVATQQMLMSMVSKLVLIINILFLEYSTCQKLERNSTFGKSSIILSLHVNTCIFEDCFFDF